MNTKRRLFLKGSMAAGVAGIAASAGLLTPQMALAAWPKAAFEAKTMADAMTGAVGSTDAADGDIKIKAPDIAENGAVVPVTISTGMGNVESISLLAEQNATPLTASFNLTASAVPFVSTRIKMGKTGNVVAVVKADGKLYRAAKEVKVTIGGCGG
jgi:sulfur-oxidizing protein SoxY